MLPTGSKINEQFQEAQNSIMAAQVLTSYLNRGDEEVNRAQEVPMNAQVPMSADLAQAHQIRAIRNHMAQLIRMSDGTTSTAHVTGQSKASQYGIPQHHLPIHATPLLTPHQLQLQRASQSLHEPREHVQLSPHFSVPPMSSKPFPSLPLYSTPKVMPPPSHVYIPSHPAMHRPSVNLLHSFGPAPSHSTNKLASSTESEHPFWLCKREGCSGMLTLLGNEKHHIKAIMNARRRAAWRRSQFPATRIHGSPMSCSVCGDRPMLKSRRSAWQRLCVVCMEPYAMNGFWCKHGGPNSRGVATDLKIRSNGHKSCMRRLAANGRKEIENFEDAVHLEKLWMGLAMDQKINGDKAEISNTVLLKHFPKDKILIDASVESGLLSKSEDGKISDNSEKKRKRDDDVSQSEIPVVPVESGIPIIKGVVVKVPDISTTSPAKRLRKGEDIEEANITGEQQV